MMTFTVLTIISLIVFLIGLEAFLLFFKMIPKTETFMGEMNLKLRKHKLHNKLRLLKQKLQHLKEIVPEKSQSKGFTKKTSL